MHPVNKTWSDPWLKWRKPSKDAFCGTNLLMLLWFYWHYSLMSYSLFRSGNTNIDHWLSRGDVHVAYLRLLAENILADYERKHDFSERVDRKKCNMLEFTCSHCVRGYLRAQLFASLYKYSRKRNPSLSNGWVNSINNLCNF